MGISDCSSGGDTTDSSLRNMENEISSGPINVNMEGHFKFEGNRLTSGHESGALLLVKVAGASLLGNHISNAKNAAITVRKTALNVRIDSNFVTSEIGRASCREIVCQYV